MRDALNRLRGVEIVLLVPLSRSVAGVLLPIVAERLEVYHTPPHRTSPRFLFLKIADLINRKSPASHLRDLNNRVACHRGTFPIRSNRPRCNTVSFPLCRGKSRRPRLFPLASFALAFPPICLPCLYRLEMRFTFLGRVWPLVQLWRNGHALTAPLRRAIRATLAAQVPICRPEFARVLSRRFVSFGIPLVSPPCPQVCLYRLSRYRLALRSMPAVPLPAFNALMDKGLRNVWKFCRQPFDRHQIARPANVSKNVT